MHDIPGECFRLWRMLYFYRTKMIYMRVTNPGSKRDILFPGILVLLAFLLYGNSLKNGYALDDAYVVHGKEEVLKGIAGIPEIITSRYADEEGNFFGYRPAATVTFALEHVFWQQNPQVSHFFNVLLYALCLILVYKVLRRIFHGINERFLFVAILLFAAHPIHTEVVNSLKNREVLLAFMFGLLALNGFISWSREKRWPSLVGGVLFFVLAYFSKQDAITFIVIIPMALVFERSGSFLKWRVPGGFLEIIKTNRYLIGIIAVMLLLGIAGAVVALLPDWFLPEQQKVLYKFENPQLVGDPRYPTWPVAFYTLFFYLKKLIWPHPLGFYYGYRMVPEVDWMTPEVILSLVLHAAVLIYALVKLPHKHILSFAILLYFIALSPFTNIFVAIPGIVGERMAFVPSLGFCIVLAFLVFKLLNYDIYQGYNPPGKTGWLTLAVLMILLPYSLKTITRNRDWKDYLTLFSHDIGYLDQSAKAHSLYASQLLKETFSPGTGEQTGGVSSAYLSTAVEHLKRAVEIDSTHKFAWNNLGFITYQYLHQPEQGISFMEMAVKADTLYDEAHYNLGYALKQQKEYLRSAHHFQEARKIKPKKLQYYLDEADVRYLMGQPDSAMQLYSRALTIDTLSAIPYLGLGNIKWQKGDTLEAIRNWEVAFNRNPLDINTCNNLYRVFQMMGDSRSEYYYKKVLDLSGQKKQ